MKIYVPRPKSKGHLSLKVSASGQRGVESQDQTNETTISKLRLGGQQHCRLNKRNLAFLAIILLFSSTICYVLFRSEQNLKDQSFIASPKVEIDDAKPKKQELKFEEEEDEDDQSSQSRKQQVSPLAPTAADEQELSNQNEQKFSHQKQQQFLNSKEQRSNNLKEQEFTHPHEQELSNQNEQEELESSIEKKSKKKKPIVPSKYLHCIVAASPAPSEQFVIKHFRTIGPFFENDSQIIYFIHRQVDFDTRNIVTPNDNVKVLTTHGSIVENIYDAVLNHCERHSLVFLLDYNQVFVGGKDNILITIKQYFFKDQGSFAFAVPIVLNNEVIEPDSQMSLTFKKDLNTNFEMLQNIENTLRCFQSDLFRMIPHWDLHDTNNKFYDSKLSFLLPILELGYQNTIQIQSQALVAIPTKLIFLTKNFIIGGNSKAVVSKKEIEVYARKMKYNSFSRVLLQQGISISTRFPEKTLSIIGSSPSNLYCIPKLIHQIWLNGEVPAVKKYFMARNIALNPSYKYRLWKMKDINKEQFPKTYPYIQKLLKIDKDCQYSRSAMIADIMRYEIIYRQGGFYIDTNYMLFKSLDQYLPFKMFMPAADSEFNRAFLSNGIFGAVARCQNIKRLLTEQSLGSIDLKSAATNRVSGPYYFKRIINLEDQVDLDIKIIPSEQGYPVNPWHYDFIQKKNKCIYSKSDEIPKKVLEEHPIDIQAGNFRILKDCNKMYPYAIGIDFYEFGASWVHRRKRL